MFSLKTKIERQAILAALLEYIRVIDGAPGQIDPIDTPDVGAPASQALSAAAAEVASAFQAFGAAAAPPVPAAVTAAPPVPAAVTAAPPVPAAAPPVPAAAPPVPAAVTAAPEVDSAGVVWDSNLHASSKAKNKDGTWRAKRSPTSAESTAAAPPVPAAVTAAPPTLQPTAKCAGATLDSFRAAGWTDDQLVEHGYAERPAAINAPADFNALMRELAGLMPGRIAPQRVNELCVQAGLLNLGDARVKPNLIPSLWSLIQASLS